MVHRGDVIEESRQKSKLGYRQPSESQKNEIWSEEDLKIFGTIKLWVELVVPVHRIIM